MERAGESVIFDPAHTLSGLMEAALAQGVVAGIMEVVEGVPGKLAKGIGAGFV